ncbi:hypothetical protein, partial [Alkalibacterium sp. s-m-28]
SDRKKERKGDSIGVHAPLSSFLSHQYIMNYTLLSPNNKDFLLALSHLGSTRFYQGLQTAYDRFFNDFLSMHPSCPKCNHTAIV